jgi:hypothetical protein
MGKPYLIMAMNFGEIWNGVDKESAVPVRSLFNRTSLPYRLLGRLLLMFYFRKVSSHALHVCLHGPVLFIILIHEEGILRLRRILHLILVCFFEILHGRVSFVLISLENRLDKNLANCNTLFEDVEMLFDTVAVIVEKREVEGF